jgi:hypothetical protein
MAATREDLIIEQGADFSKSYQINGADGNPYDLTGSVARAQVRKTYSDKNVLLQFSIYIAGPEGRISLFAPAVETSNIPVSKATSYQKIYTNYCWDMELELPDGRIIRLFEGVAQVSPEVTR